MTNTQDTNSTMGSWKLSHHCPSIIINSGVQAVRDKATQGVFALRYDWLLEQIKAKPKAKEYKLKGTSPITLAKAITQNRLQDLGKLEEIERPISVDVELKRCYRIEPRNGKELLSNQYDSVPWDISVVSNSISSIKDTEGVTI